jgi:hypothetical protein
MRRARLRRRWYGLLRKYFECFMLSRSCLVKVYVVQVERYSVVPYSARRINVPRVAKPVPNAVIPRRPGGSNRPWAAPGVAFSVFKLFCDRLRNMPKAPKIPSAEVVAGIRRQVVKNDRAPFADILADALSVAPSKTAMRQLARQNPRQFVSMLRELADLNGYASRSEHVTVKHDARSMALELVNRVGPERAKAVLADFGLPSSLIPRETPHSVPDAPIEGELVPEVQSGESPDKPQPTKTE